MKRFLAVAIMLISLTPLGALAQERAGDAALGGLSGAIVLGPVGAVAGIIVGYAAGPAISRSWGLKRSDARYQEQTTKRPVAAPPNSAVPPSNSAASKQVATQNVAAASPKPAPAAKRNWNSPPVQGFE
ncbi:MAG TPA: DNA-directed RNA polymerase subunit N [Xanthobacteraceae bacterium]|nr:DNA-directed RNA polymerase subunit N [Xanthobacteraceae bacterium]